MSPPDPADFPFLTFACAAGTRTCKSTTPSLPNGRQAQCRGQAGSSSRSRLRGASLLTRASCAGLGEVPPRDAGTVRGFWRGLSRVDAVWVLGQHPFSFVLVGLALVRRRKVVLGVRQDTIAYFRGRLPNAKWSPALLPVRIWNTGFRGLSRMLKTTVVGDELARSYGRERSRLLPIAVALVRNADVVSNPPDRDWTGRIGLLTVGRVDPEKNPLLLVEAMAELARQRPGGLPPDVGRNRPARAFGAGTSGRGWRQRGHRDARVRAIRSRASRALSECPRICPRVVYRRCPGRLDRGTRKRRAQS